MAYKTILVHADLGTASEERIRFSGLPGPSTPTLPVAHRPGFPASFRLMSPSWTVRSWPIFVRPCAVRQPRPWIGSHGLRLKKVCRWRRSA